jgi:hypothetical protein
MARRRSEETEAKAVQTTEVEVEVAATMGVETPGFTALRK